MKFSILNLLLVITAAAALLALRFSHLERVELTQRHERVISAMKGELRALENEVAAMRQEIGMLTITDPAQIHAVKVPSSAALQWSYRVYLPKGSDYYFACQINSLPDDRDSLHRSNPPSINTIARTHRNGIGMGQPPGEYIVTLSIEQKNSEWTYRLNVRESGKAEDGSTGSGRINDANNKWPSTSDWVAVGGVTDQVRLSKDRSFLALLDFRAMSETDTSSAGATQGAMLWVGTSPRR
ncbi:hypothetical protein [Rubripirellula obstinata]|nr:hypothetical protein [Rubripirellula obstinata]